MARSLQDIADLLTSDDTSEGAIFDKATELFELEVSLVFPTPRKSHVRRRQQARLFVALWFLERKLSDLRDALGRPPVIDDLKSDPLYQRLHSTVCFSTEALRSLRHLSSARTFDRRFRARWRESKAVAELIDVSYRFDPSGTTTKRTGGITTARVYVTEAPEYEGQYRLTRLAKLWREYEASALMLFLIRKLKFPYRRAV